MRLKSSDWEALVKARDARIAQLETEVKRLTDAGLNAAYGEVAAQGEAADWFHISEQKSDRITELAAQVKTLQNARQWSPVEHREVIGDERWPETVWVVVGEHGFSFCTSYSTDHIRLPNNIRLCREVQP